MPDITPGIMGYVKTEWETGDIITAEKLNNMEDGIESITEYATTNYMYCVTGDYSDEDIISDEYYDRLVAAFEEGGIGFIRLVGTNTLGNSEPFIASVTNDGIFPITETDSLYGVQIADESPHTVTITLES